MVYKPRVSWEKKKMQLVGPNVLVVLSLGKWEIIGCWMSTTFPGEAHGCILLIYEALSFLQVS